MRWKHPDHTSGIYTSSGFRQPDNVFGVYPHRIGRGLLSPPHHSIGTKHRKIPCLTRTIKHIILKFDKENHMLKISMHLHFLNVERIVYTHCIKVVF